MVPSFLCFFPEIVYTYILNYVLYTCSPFYIQMVAHCTHSPVPCFCFHLIMYVGDHPTSLYKWCPSSLYIFYSFFLSRSFLYQPNRISETRPLLLSFGQLWTFCFHKQFIKWVPLCVHHFVHVWVNTFLEVELLAKPCAFVVLITLESFLFEQQFFLDLMSAGGLCGKRNQDDILERSEIFFTTGIPPPTRFGGSFRLDFSGVSKPSGNCRVLHKEHSLLFPQPPPTAPPMSTDDFLLNMVCLSNSLSRPLPFSPQTPNGSRKHPTSHLPMPSVTAVVFVYVWHLGYILNPS